MGALNWREGSTRLAYPSGTDFTSSQTVFEPTYQGVKFGSGSTAGQVIPCAAATDEVLGIIMNCPIVGDSADILAINNTGSGKVASGAAITIGQYLTMDSTGRAVAATQTSAGSQPTVRVFGRALTAASAAGQLVEFESFYFLY
ncbi:MAG TPA: hypothetical protein VNG51_19380 [Ktedonobacteraceae bacterium]|nr:hypothetical protein [Ktedonobacteraceae bacterium]